MCTPEFSVVPQSACGEKRKAPLAIQNNNNNYYYYNYCTFYKYLNLTQKYVAPIEM